MRVYYAVLLIRNAQTSSALFSASRRLRQSGKRVHEFGKALAVVAFQEVGHLMDDDILEAVGVLLGEFEVDPDVAGLSVA